MRQCCRWASLHLGYTESKGLPELRQQIAKLYTSVSPEEVVVCVPEEGVFLAMHALLQAGDEIVCMYPGKRYECCILM